MVGYLVAVLLLFGKSQSADDLTQLARSGNIQETAPVKASLQITISAPPEKVWDLLTDVNHWPKWQPAITQAEISGPLQGGTEFTWSSGAQIHSRIALVKPSEEFVWTGKAYMARAIHVWKLERLPDGHTVVRTTESMDGPMLSLFFPSKKLQESDQRWLEALKAAAEK